MSHLDELSAAALLALVGASALTTNANAFQPRKYCDLQNWWSCGTDVEPQANRSRHIFVPPPLIDNDTRNRAMLDAGGGGGGGGR